MKALTGTFKDKKMYLQVIVHTPGNGLQPFWNENIANAKPLNEEQAVFMKDEVSPWFKNVTDIVLEDLPDDFVQDNYSVIIGG